MKYNLEMKCTKCGSLVFPEWFEDGEKVVCEHCGTIHELSLKLVVIGKRIVVDHPPWRSEQSGM